MNASRSIVAGASLFVTLWVAQVAQAQVLNGTPLTITGSSTVANGLTTQVWPLSPGQNNTNLGNGNTNNNWGTVNNDSATATSLQNTINAFGPAIIRQLLPNNTTPPSLPNGPNYGGPSNPFAGTAPATGYVGGLDFPNNGQNNFAANGINIVGQGFQQGQSFGNSGAPNYTPNPSNAAYNSMTAQWSGIMNVSQAGSINFNVDSDDFAALVVDGTVVLNRGNGGTGFSGNGNGGGGTGNATPISLSVGAHTISAIWDEGGGGWGIVGMYSFTPTSGPVGPTSYIGNDDNTDGVTFTSNVLGPANNGGAPIESQSGAQTLTVNSFGSASTVGQVTLDNGTNLTVNGTATGVTFGGTVLNGTSMTINNSVPVEAGLVTSSGGWGIGNTPTAAGSGMLYLDNTGNSSTFIAGTTISATNAGGAVIGVNIGGTDSLGAATLNLNGGNFSLGTDGGVQNFANPITVTGGVGNIVAQAVGAGTAINGTVNLTGGISLGGNTLNLYTTNGYTIGANSAITGNGTIGANGNIAINAASSGFTGTYNVNGGTTTENVAGGFGLSAGGAYVNIFNGTTLNMKAASDNLGGGATVNGGGNLNIQAANVDISNTTVNGSGNLNVSQSGTTGNNVNMANGANLSLSGGSPVSFGANMTLAAGATNVNNSGQNFSLTGNIGGAGGLSLNGNGTTTLSGAAGSASYAGTTNVNAGTLALQTNLTGGGQVNVNPNTTLNIGANGSLGTSALSNSGLTTLTANGASLGSGPITSTGGQLLFNTLGGNTGNYTGSSINLTDSTLHVSSGSANLNNAVITGNVSVVSPGLSEGRLTGNQTNNIDATTPNPGNGGLQAGPLLAYSNNVVGGQPVSAHVWDNNTTWVYTGQINITPQEAANGITFGKSIDDATILKIDGHTLINDNNWNVPAGVYLTGLTAGLHSFELRMGNGGGGAVNVGNSGFGGSILPLPGNVPSSLWAAGTTLGLGFGFITGSTPTLANPFNLPVSTLTSPVSTTIGSGGGVLSPMFDNGTGNLFQFTTPGTTISVDSGTLLTAGSIASAQQLNLNGTLNLTSTTPNTVGNVVNATVAAPAVLNLGANNSFSANSTTITDGNSLTLTGAGHFNVLGGQTMTVGTTNAATAMNVNGGVFHVDGTVSGPGVVNVNAGGSLGGAGTLGLSVHINAGGTLAPGDAANTNVGGLTLADNSNMTYNLNTAGVTHATYNPANGNDLTTVINNNALALSSNPYSAGIDGTTVNIIAGPNFSHGLYELLAYTGTFTGSLSSFGIGSAQSGNVYEFLNVPGAGGGQIDLFVTPEPSAVVLMGLGLVGLVLHCRRRLAKRAA